MGHRFATAFYSKDYRTQHPVIQKHLDVLDRISNIFGILYTDDGKFKILDLRHGDHRHNLTRTEATELSKLFKDIADEMQRVEGGAGHGEST